jgi:hypothetical protein
MSATINAPDAPLQNNLLIPPTIRSDPYKSHIYKRISFPSISKTLIEKSQAIVARYSSSKRFYTNLFIN